MTRAEVPVDVRTELDDLVPVVIDRRWDAAPEGPADGLIRPVPTAEEPDLAFRQVLDAATRWSNAGEVVVVGLEPASGPAAATATAAVVAGARTLVLTRGDADDVRDARRAVDVAVALLAERAS